MAQPVAILLALKLTTPAAEAAPIALNAAALVTALALAAVALVVRPGSRAVALLASALLVPVWLLGQDVCGLVHGHGDRTAIPLASWCGPATRPWPRAP